MGPAMVVAYQMGVCQPLCPGPIQRRRACGDGIAYLLDVAGRTDHPLAIEQGGDLLDAEAVLLDRQGGLDGVDAVLAA
jgi:hypothetical protein